jgi:hypothetical protein
LIVSVFAYTGAATATTWSNGDETTFNQPGWGEDPTASAILTSNYNKVYAATGGVQSNSDLRHETAAPGDERRLTVTAQHDGLL